MTFTCMRCLSDTDNDSDLCDACIAESQADEADRSSTHAPEVPTQLANELLWGRFVNHYWDSFEGEKQIVLKHIRAVLDYHIEHFDPAQSAAMNERDAIARILDPRPTGPAGWALNAADLAVAHADSCLSSAPSSDTVQVSAVMWEIWAEWFRFYTDHFRGSGIAISMADQQAFFEIAQPRLAALSAAPVGVSRDAVIEECARNLEQSYPGHTWLNAACAATRSLTRHERQTSEVE